MMKSCSGLSFIHSVPRMTLMKRAGSDRIRDSMLELKHVTMSLRVARNNCIPQA